ncbi:hypothetical protein KUTeg_009671 [Tegillarca granosa]|uniref:Uncharacterized protein n=1 Tax=Tegillarca granosa TaxID=220873 RepID=A0ABQ9F9N1_TEGGR|nr:hypothetical protein KUTeg_009671 [Tegillarca granosa]
MLKVTVKCFFLVFLFSRSVAVLPDIPGCVPLEDHPFDTIDPASIFGSNTEVGIKAPPRRVGNLPILKNDGITYDASTMERWYDPARTDTMQQQSAWESGKPWNKILSMGTNLRQLVSGPDGNPTGVFTGRSGIRVGISGSGEPEMTDFGDLYATFMYTGSGGGIMEVPLVRGSVLPTHIFKNANPVIKPHCLSDFNGQTVKFDCPKENSMADGGSGHLSGSCSNGVLRIQLNNSKKVTDITLIQFAASTKSQWSDSRNHPPMITCTTSTCRIVNEGRTVEIDIPNASGMLKPVKSELSIMAFAANYIGRYILPWDWIAHPEEVTCSESGKRADLQERSADDISAHAKCDTSRNVEIIINLASNNIPGIDKIQYAIEPSDQWGNPPPMYTCSSAVCQRVGNMVVIKKTVTSDNLNEYHWLRGDSAKGLDKVPTTKPPCGSQTTSSQPTPKPTTGGQTTSSQPTVKPTTGGQTTGTHATVKPTKGTKFMMELDEPGNELPNQTRKYLVYFSEPVTPHVNTGDSTISFTPNSGGTYNGIMQVAYLGAGPRGDHSNDTLLDQYLGVYPYKPKTSYCVWESSNQALVRHI